MGASGPTVRGVAVEVAVIVGSILLAFAIDASWDARSERIEARSMLLDLQSEFEANLALIDRIIGIRESRAARSELLLQGASAFPDDESLNEALVHVFLGSTTVNLPTGALSTYVAGGNAARIESRELRTLLASWPGLLEENAEEEVFEAQLARGQMTTFLSSRVDLAPIYSAHPAAAEVYGTFPDVDAGFRTEARDLLSDPEFHNLTVVRLGLTRVLLREARALRSATADILALIARELER